jgi:hypothetical protein
LASSRSASTGNSWTPTGVRNEGAMSSPGWLVPGGRVRGYVPVSVTGSGTRGLSDGVGVGTGPAVRGTGVHTLLCHEAPCETATFPASCLGTVSRSRMAAFIGRCDGFLISTISLPALTMDIDWVSRRMSGPFDADADGFGSALPLPHPASTAARAAAVAVTAIACCRTRTSPPDRRVRPS